MVRDRRPWCAPSPWQCLSSAPCSPVCLNRSSERHRTPCDQKLHNLVSAGIDTHHARVAIHTRDRKFLHIAVAAEELQATIDDLSLQIGDPILGHGGRNGIERAAKIALDAMV